MSASVAHLSPLDPLAPDSRGYVRDEDRWTLCIGAGISAGIVPQWEEFAQRVIQRVFGSSTQISKDHLSLDGWLQAAANRFRANGETRAHFNVILQQEFYGELLKAAKTANVAHEVFDWKRTIWA